MGPGRGPGGPGARFPRRPGPGRLWLAPGDLLEFGCGAGAPGSLLTVSIHPPSASRTAGCIGHGRPRHQ